MKEEKAVFLDVEKGKTKVMDFKDDLEYFYDLIKCDTVDIVRRKIFHKYYTVICDDMGLLKEQQKVSAINFDFKVMFVGNLIIAGDIDNEGNIKGLSEKEAKEIIEKAVKHTTIITPNGNTQLGYEVLICEG